MLDSCRSLRTSPPPPFTIALLRLRLARSVASFARLACQRSTLGMFASTSGSRLVARAARLDLASLAATRPSSSSSSLLTQARSLAVLSTGCSRSQPALPIAPLVLHSPVSSQPATSLVWTLARRSFHSSRPTSVIRDSYYQDDRPRSNSRDGGRGPAPKGGWDRLKQAFWDAVLRFERLPPNVVVRRPSNRLRTCRRSRR